MFTLFQMTFYLKFLSLTVKVERDKYKIDNIKIILNLLTELKSYLKRYLQRKWSLQTATYRQNKQKIRRRKGVPKVPPLKELGASRISYLITNSVRKMKSTTFLHLKSPLRKRGVERAKLKFTNYFPDREFDKDLAQKREY